MMTELTIVLNRGTNSMATSFDLWAKFQSYPECDGDGVFVANVTIDADDTSVTYEWETPNGSANWRFLAVPRYLDQVGLAGRIDAA